MKGIYVLDSCIKERDFDLISRARQRLDYVTLAVQLVFGESGKECLGGVSDIRKGLVERDILGVSIDFFKEGELSSFLNRQTERVARVYHIDGSLRGFRSFKRPGSPDVRLIVPANMRREYSQVNFPKYFVN